jgi:hypothetical protein
MNSLDTDLWDRDEMDSSDMEDDFYTGDKEFRNEIKEDFDFEDEENTEQELSIVDNARIRLEQGRLYEMLIKHDLFDGVDAMPQAVNKVQSEIKEFIVERLEILLGMKTEKQKVEVHHVKESQFNEVEVQALKMIARKVTKGASDTASVEISRPRNELNSVKKDLAKSVSKPQTLNQPKSIAKTPASLSQKPIEKKTTMITTTNASAKQASIKKNRDPIIQEKPNSNSPEDIAKQDIKYIESLKNMSLEEAGRVVAQKHTRPMPPRTIDQESVNRLYTTKMAVNETAHSFAKLLAAAQKK